MTMTVAIIFDVLMLIYFGSKVGIADIIIECLIKKEDRNAGDRSLHGAASADRSSGNRTGRGKKDTGNAGRLRQSGRAYRRHTA